MGSPTLPVVRDTPTSHTRHTNQSYETHQPVIKTHRHTSRHSGIKLKVKHNYLGDTELNIQTKNASNGTVFPCYHTECYLEFVPGLLLLLLLLWCVVPARQGVCPGPLRLSLLLPSALETCVWVRRN